MATLPSFTLPARSVEFVSHPCDPHCLLVESSSIRAMLDRPVCSAGKDTAADRLWTVAARQRPEGRRLMGHRGGIRGRSLVALQGQEFLTVNRHVTRRLDTQANLAP